MNYTMICTAVLKGLNAFKESPFIKAANNEIEIAKKNAQCANTKEETRHILTHLETAASLVSASGFSTLFGTWDLYDRIEQFNELCYLIAFLHHSLQDDYSLVKNWADKVNTDRYFPDDFKGILLKQDYDKMKSEYNAVQSAPSLYDCGLNIPSLCQ